MSHPVLSMILITTIIIVQYNIILIKYIYEYCKVKFKSTEF